MRVMCFARTVAKTIFLLLALATVPAASFAADPVIASATSASIFLAPKGQLDPIRARGQLACGVNSQVAGLAYSTAGGVWRGLEVDLCRAVAAAIFGDAGKAKFVPIEMTRQLPVLQSREIDMLSDMTTPTLARRTSGEMDFAGVHYYDRQGFMVLRDSSMRSIKDLDGKSVCVERGTTAESNIADYFLARRMVVELLVMETAESVRTAFLEGRCDVMAAGLSRLYAARSAHVPNRSDYRILPETASIASVGPAVRRGDTQLAGIVRWAINATIEAEEYGITSGNVDEMLKSESLAIQRLLGVTPGLGAALGIRDKWAYHVIKQVGNYGESYDRNLGAQSALDVPRGLNRLSSQGGMLYAPSIR